LGKKPKPAEIFEAIVASSGVLDGCSKFKTRVQFCKSPKIAYVISKLVLLFAFSVKLARLYPLKVRFPFEYFEHWLQPSAYLQFSPFQLILFIMPLLAHDDNLADVMLSGCDSGDTD
jgi:hypothetical protein